MRLRASRGSCSVSPPGNPCAAFVVLGHHGLFDHFTTIQTADTAPSKPHPAMLHDAMREAGATPGDTVMIGDTVFDIADGAGSRCDAGRRKLGISSGGGSARGRRGCRGR